MKNIRKALQRPLYLLAAFALLAGVAAPLFVKGFAAADGQVQERSIKLSTAVPGATGVTYSVSFKSTFTVTNPGIVIEFCDDTPLIAAACSHNNTTATTNTVPLFSSAASSVGTFASLGANNVVKITGTTGTMTSGSAFTFDLTGVANPSKNINGTDNYGSFYARIYVYNDATAANAYTANSTDDTAATAFGTYRDYGGAAMSTVNTINVTARVMESLSFCTSAKDISGGNFGGLLADNSCVAATTPSIIIGHGSPTAVIDSTAVDTTPAYFQLSTNATNGATVRMKATNACANGGLSTDGGTTCTFIPGNATTPTVIAAGTPSFGMYVSPSATTAGVGTSTGTITPDATYNAANDNTKFAMDGTEVTSTYGSAIASCTAPVSQVNNQLLFAATAGLTTPAGIYTGGESLIATGTF